MCSLPLIFRDATNSGSSGSQPIVNRVDVKLVAKICCLFLLSSVATTRVYAQLPHFEHIIIVIQENRTPDNLFGGDPTFEQGVDIQRATGTPPPQPWCLGACFSPDHEHPSWLTMWNGGGSGWDNGGHACQIPIHNNCYQAKDGTVRTTYCNGQPISLPSSQCVPKTWVSKTYDNGVVQPYYDIATRYGFANYFFQTNQGPSYPAHQFLFSGTSSPSGVQGGLDYQLMVADNVKPAGCNSDQTPRAHVADAAGNDNDPDVPPVPPCFDHRSMPSLLDNHVTWKYYAQPGDTWLTSIWTAPNSLVDICGFDGTKCNSYDWNHYVTNVRGQILTDIDSCTLPQVSWVIPNGDASDHPGMTKADQIYSTQIEKGPAWVAAIINAVGSSWAGSNHTCDYWGGHTTDSRNQPTVIMVVWDDWGGWWDHVNPQSAPNLPVLDGDPLCNQWGCGNTYGFRVPFLLVSAFMAPTTGGVPPYQGYVSGDTRMQHETAPYIHDFGSILAFTEHNFSLGFINPGYEFADFFAPEVQAQDIPLADFFCGNSCPAQTFLSIPEPVGAWQATDFSTDTDVSDPDDDAIDND